ncbi:MAG: cupredoxin domain-containing protein [Rhodocyclales bacterium]|nr:cupredoxin domain-containing protein [Rhodocyclales bacterium]
MLPGGMAVAAGELPAFEIVVNNGYFKPKRIEVPAGRRVKLILINEGPGPLEFENDEMHIEKVLNAGARSFVVLPPLKPGQYDFVDEFNPITGELTVIAK